MDHVEILSVCLGLDVVGSYGKKVVVLVLVFCWTRSCMVNYFLIPLHLIIVLFDGIQVTFPNSVPAGNNTTPNQFNTIHLTCTRIITKVQHLYYVAAVLAIISSATRLSETPMNLCHTLVYQSIKLPDDLASSFYNVGHCREFLCSAPSVISLALTAAAGRNLSTVFVFVRQQRSC
jgi:hypothetical protein